MKNKMLRSIQDKICISGGRKGFGTVEIVLITAVLIALAMMFRTATTSYAENLLDSVFQDPGIMSSSISGETLNE